MKLKKCIVCGKEFEAVDGRQKICSDLCRSLNKDKAATKEEKKKAAEKAKDKKKKPVMSIDEKARIAKEHGMSYGELDAELSKVGLAWSEWGKLFAKKVDEVGKRAAQISIVTTGQQDAEDPPRQQAKPEPDKAAEPIKEDTWSIREVNEAMRRCFQGDADDTALAKGQQFKAPKKLYPIVVSELTRLTAEREQALSEYHKAMQIVKTIERRVTSIEENMIVLKDFKNNTQFI